MKITPDVKKHLIKNLPYMVIFFAAWKISSQLEWIPYPAPLVALTVTATLRLMAYSKSKNAKKYRRNEEYGSARWGTSKDIRPYIDPKPENNIILTQTDYHEQPSEACQVREKQKCAGYRRLRFR